MPTIDLNRGKRQMSSLWCVVLAADGPEAFLPAAAVESLKRQGGAHRFVTVLRNDPGLIAQLYASKVRYTGGPLLCHSGSETAEMFVGAGVARVRDLFWMAEQRVFDGVSTGAENGLQRATGAARPEPSA